MQRMKIFRWLAPGLRIKRWLFLFTLGVVCLIFGLLLLLNYQWLWFIEDFCLRILYQLTGSYNYTVVVMVSLLAMFIGLMGMYIGAKNLVSTIVHAILPTNEDKKVGDFIFNKLKLDQGPKIVVIGGGTGLSMLLRGLKKHSSNLTAIVTVADDGGSSGRIREDLKMIAPGDLRNCLVALAEKETLMEHLFKYRFPGEGDLSGHSFGNLFLAAMTGVLDDNIEAALEASSKILKVRGRVIPSTTENINLCAVGMDGKVTCGESLIPNMGQPIKSVHLLPEDVVAEGAALQAIDEADLILLGPGSLYTSIMPNLLINKITEHIKASKANKIYICNVMTQPGETAGYTVGDHIEAIENHAGKGLIDMVLVNETQFKQGIIDRYAKVGAQPVEIDSSRIEAKGIKIVRANLIDSENKAVHDSARLASVVVDIYNAMQTKIEPHVLEYYLTRNVH